MKFVEWDGKDLPGTWIVSYKIDGIHADATSGTVVTKNGKPLYNLPLLIEQKFQRAEIYCGSWSETWSIVSASKSPRRRVRLDEVFSLVPLDPRLFVGTVQDLTAEEIQFALEFALKRRTKIIPPGGENAAKLLVGFSFAQLLPPIKPEGLVLYNLEKDLYVKVKPKQTVDVEVTGIIKSTAKSHYGLLKEFVTPYGKVGTGLTKKQRKEFLKKDIIGSIIEVEITEFTKNKKWRHPRFVRLRPDKTK